MNMLSNLPRRTGPFTITNTAAVNVLTLTPWEVPALLRSTFIKGEIPRTCGMRV